MIYKLFIWKHEDKYILVFPEIDPGMITIGEDKQEAKIEAIVKARLALKNMQEYPPNKSIEDMYDLLNTLPEEEFISTSGVEFDKNTA